MHGHERLSAKERWQSIRVTNDYENNLGKSKGMTCPTSRKSISPLLHTSIRATGFFPFLPPADEGASRPHHPFRANGFVADLARQMEALRGRELPGFMSAQSFYMFIQEFIDAWAAPARMAAAQMRALANEVVHEMFEKIAVSYPNLRASFQTVASSILESSEEEALGLLEGLVIREKDPFTINEFLQAHINKLRFDRFETSVNAAFKGTAYDGPGTGSWQATKEHVGASLRSWYRSAHGVSSSANAEDMSAILEAYWTLASKRFIDNACMCLDDRILGTLCGKLQEKCYHFVHV